MPKMTAPVPPAMDGEHTSTAQQDGDGSSSWQDGDETARIQPAVDRDQTTLPLQEDRHHATSTQGQTDPPQATQKNRTWSSWLGFSKKSKPCASADNEGVDIPAAAEIGKLTDLTYSWCYQCQWCRCWIEQLGNLENLKLELTVSGQEDIGALSDLRFNKTEVITRLCVKLSQGGKLDLGFVWVFSLYSSLAVFEIDCISSSEITFGYSMMAHVELLKVRCWKEASLTFSVLEQLRSLKEVWLMGSFDDDTLKQEMQKQLAVHENKPVLKLLKQCSS
ncbi:hypothetical protein HU200_043428 [Digitaria exilis]|uniref:Uncharacterized protein n=1 Tax=Digitaria exilis TaxID=1010633 RepID=A0A835EDV1_9POAL|nr:hypothetical protein HU200_043428 [Digitaria exilis]